MYQQKPNISYISQLGILIGLVGAGLLFGGILSVVLLFSQLGMAKATDVTQLFKPENVNLLRWLQIISTLFMFFVPTIVFARIVSKKPFPYLGYNKWIKAEQVVLVVLIMIACLPVVGALGELTQKIPLSPGLAKKFKDAEDNYEKQVETLMAMKNSADYIWSMLIVAILPAVFEETLFRGGLQNMLLRWKNSSPLYVIALGVIAAFIYGGWFNGEMGIAIFSPLLIAIMAILIFVKPIKTVLDKITNHYFAAILLTSIIFSAVHFSFFGFFARAALGVILGLIYYYSGNIWLNILAHMFNNGAAVTFMYFQIKKTGKMPGKELDSTMPLWSGAVALIILAGLIYAFIRISKPMKEKADQEAAPPMEDNWLNL
ncbi:MAG: CPBP family intramembrane metalloprotease [Sphingobacteriales bacterium]|nr:CPBP family intramembrane metalloprotease [Sphingobacteriales bacterium]